MTVLKSLPILARIEGDGRDTRSSGRFSSRESLMQARLSNVKALYVTSARAALLAYVKILPRRGCDWKSI
jgi:hypothetical protein